MNEKLSALEKELKEANKEVKLLRKMGRAASFKSLSDFSVNLHEEKVTKAHAKVSDLVEKVSDLVSKKEVTLEEGQRVIKRSLK